jgi:Rha family phage regulatory protein
MSDIILSAQNGQAVVSSLDIAEKFEKRHNHVMRDIKNIMKNLPKNEDTPMFFKTEYVHPQNGQTYPIYLINQNGFTLLIMSFNKSAKAMEWKLKYIQAFNKMEKKLTTPEPKPPELALSKALVMAQSIIAKEQKRSKQLEKENAKLKPAAEYAHNMLLNDETLTMTQIALNFGMTANKLNKLLEEWGIQKKVNKQWIPKRKYIDKDYTMSIPVEIGNGETKENTRWNRTRQAFIYKQMHNHGYLTMKKQAKQKAKERKVLSAPAEQSA